ETKQKCVQAIKGLFESPMLQLIADSDPAGWIIEDLDHAEFSQYFQYEDVKVYVKTDLMFRGKDGTFNIVDWKTHSGTKPFDEEVHRSQDSSVQLGVYGYYAVNVRKEPLGSIRLYEVNLLGGGCVTGFYVDDESMEIFRDHIRKGISKLSSLLVGGDIERNEPLSPEHFPKVESRHCPFCNFFRICKDESFSDRLL
ncbi:MAG: PD-(D/E)XK nuclease family protein, partial [Candidatus Krumholzibacteria bacterium]|nr:PD-(D/E)XK nuclease family protein [Candidatus Krumholzibacteria bacterium]